MCTSIRNKPEAIIPIVFLLMNVYWDYYEKYGSQKGYRMFTEYKSRHFFEKSYKKGQFFVVE